MTHSTAIALETPEYAARARQRRASARPDLYQLLDAVRDPELPELSIWDLGVLRDVRERQGEVVVTITPTYSGCPALDVIREDIDACLRAAGFGESRIIDQTNPPWTTALMSRAAKTPTQHQRRRAANVKRRFLPALRQRRHHAGQPIRRNGLQGSLPLQRLP